MLSHFPCRSIIAGGGTALRARATAETGRMGSSGRSRADPCRYQSQSVVTYSADPSRSHHFSFASRQASAPDSDGRPGTRSFCEGGEAGCPAMEESERSHRGE